MNFLLFYFENYRLNEYEEIQTSIAYQNKNLNVLGQFQSRLMLISFVV